MEKPTAAGFTADLCATLQGVKQQGNDRPSMILDTYMGLRDDPQSVRGIDRNEAGIPDEPCCASCGVKLGEPFGWCSNCREAFCANCGREHYCNEHCRTAGCFAGLCVRSVADGVLSPIWKRPPVDS